MIEAQLPAIVSLDRDLLTELVTASVRHKAAVVVADEREERGDRVVLNFGHTIGHAVETLTEYRTFLHGEAVAIGMVAAARVSHALGICDEKVPARLSALLERAGLPTAIPDDLGPAAIAIAMQADKKSAGGRIRFVALEAIGRTASRRADANRDRASSLTCRVGL